MPMAMTHTLTFPLAYINNAIEKREMSDKNRDEFSERLKMVHPKLLRHYLFGYANPLYSKLAAGYDD